MSTRGRRLLARALVVAASLAILLALVAAYVRSAAVNSDQFANRATVALRDERVRTLIAERITDDVVLANQQDLLAARPIIESVASTVVGSRAFTGVFRAAVRDVHRAVFNRDANTVTLTVADVGTILGAALEKLRPALAKDVDASGRVTLIRRDLGSASGDAARFADSIKVLALLLVVLSVALVAGAVAVSPDRRETVVELGIGTAAAGVLLVVALAVLRSIAVGHVDGTDNQDAARAVWDAFLGDLRTAAWILASAGAVIAAAAASLIRPADLREPLGRLARRIAVEPERPALRALRGAALVAAGLVVLLARDWVLQLLLTVTGVFLVYGGLLAVLRLVYQPPAPDEESALEEVAEEAPRVARRILPALIAAGVVAGTVAVFVGTGGTTTAAPAEGSCNGHEELCDRRLDEVALPATHNAMSVPLPGWYSAEQERPIADQLADGVRGLLVDTHYADRLPNGKLRTYFGSREELRRQVKQDGISPDAVDAALRTRERLGFSGEGERGMYLCHTFCELGGTRLDSVLDDLHDFLVANPGAVVVVINQDYVTPADFVRAVRDADLEDFAYRGPTGEEDWLTLREMVDTNQRVVFLAENHAGAAPWYHPVYKRITEETPYTFPKVSQLTDPAELPASCKQNRGPAGAPLFLMNHWISTDPLPRPSDAEKVNARAPLLRRARACQRIRKHLPNLVAVNFYRRGDVFGVVNTLNGVR
jgi:hypothetical protein